MSDEKERRLYRGRVTLLRTSGNAMPQLDGYAAVFNSETVIGSSPWGFRETIAPGAFTQTIRDDDVRGLFNHDDNYVLGRTKSGTLRLSEDGTGLRYIIDPPDTSVGRDVVTLVGRGDIDGSSFAFVVGKDGDSWNYDDVQRGKLPLRTIKKASLLDVSCVTFPAYISTSVTVSARALKRATRDQEQPTMKTYGKCSRCGDDKKLRGGHCKRCRRVLLENPTPVPPSIRYAAMPPSHRTHVLSYAIRREGDPVECPNTGFVGPSALIRSYGPKDVAGNNPFTRMSYWPTTPDEPRPPLGVNVRIGIGPAAGNKFIGMHSDIIHPWYVGNPWPRNRERS